MIRERGEYQKAYYEANKEVIKAQRKAYREANKEKISGRNKIWREANAKYRRAYYEANKEAMKAKRKAYREANKKKIARQKMSYKESNKEKVKGYEKNWRAKNRGRRNALEAKRYTAKLNRTPCWLTEADFEKIERKYAFARRKIETTGERWDVDHIIPLQGKFVSGLHVPANLRVIKHITNCRKRNHFDLEKEWALS